MALLGCGRWRDVDDPAEARLALERGADTVTSNNPSKLLASRGCKTGMDGTSSLAE